MYLYGLLLYKSSIEGKPHITCSCKRQFYFYMHFSIRSFFRICVSKLHTWLIALMDLILYIFLKATVSKEMPPLNLLKSSSYLRKAASYLIYDQSRLRHTFPMYLAVISPIKQMYISCYELTIFNKKSILFIAILTHNNYLYS